MDVLRAICLMAATLCMGLIAGAFVLYAHTIMPGLRKTDDRTFIAAFQALDRAIINPWFMGSGFLGALVFSAVAAILQMGRPAQPWVSAALLLYVVTVTITIAINVPLNDGLKSAGDPATLADPAAVRRRFDEPRWARWNLVRVVTTSTAFALLAWSLVVYGRST